ncbi:MAG TPA: RluA family pseudouridine synthase [Fimbriimonadaceae bacterium]|nr:RluA family pseudouridine synthase [Fimbriimonadaceae bacterium]
MRLIADRVERLDQFLARSLPHHSRSRLAELARERRVLVEGRPQKPSFKLEPGHVVSLDEPTERPPHDLTPMKVDLDVRYEDKDLLVVNKPRGLATHPAPSLKDPSLVNALLGRATGLSAGSATYRPGIVHRLDKETTGLLLVAKTDAVHAALARQIERREVDRSYVALVAGDLDREPFRIEAPLGRDPRNRLKMAVVAAGKPAATRVAKLRRCDVGTLVACRLETGRTHQIRVHLASIGHPVVGDRVYAPKEHRGLPMQLHAALLRFRHPVTAEQVEVFAEPPPDFLEPVARAELG